MHVDKGHGGLLAVDGLLALLRRNQGNLFGHRSAKLSQQEFAAGLFVERHEASLRSDLLFHRGHLPVQK